jgi:cobyrinic acid a,c-diamide synthase
VPVAERAAAASQAIARLAALVTESVDLATVLTLASTAGPLPAAPWDPRTALTERPPAERGHAPVVAVAGGAAFTFCYTETVELLTAAGAEVVTVDPLRDETLPAGTRALVLGGGFPEVHASELSANERLRAGVARLAGSGAPVAAECAGLLYLSTDLDGLPMCGVIDASARLTGRLTLGYRDATAPGTSVLAPAGTPVRGHEFHRTTVAARNHGTPAWTFGGQDEGFVRSGVHASYLHLHWAGYPAMARRLVHAASADSTASTASTASADSTGAAR